jgi:Leucine-rich repeat (LRR) protein
MTPEEEAYAEALRRILKAKGRGAVRLDLSGLPLNRLPRELSAITALQSLDLSYCKELSDDLSFLDALTALRLLDLSNCWQLHDLSSLTRLTSLRSLYLSKCWRLRDLSPLAALTSLQSLDLSWCRFQLKRRLNTDEFPSESTI